MDRRNFLRLAVSGVAVATALKGSLLQPRRLMAATTPSESLALSVITDRPDTAISKLQTLFQNFDPSLRPLTFEEFMLPGVHIGDIVVCREWIQHDYGYIGSAGFEPRGVNVYSPRPDSLVRMSRFVADTALLRLATAVGESGLEFKSVGNRVPVIHVGGVGVSGNTFIDSREKREWLSTTFHSLITDMESASVAHVCVVNDLPFIVVRSASDLAGGSGSETAKEELEAFFTVAADNSSRVVIALLR